MCKVFTNKTKYILAIRSSTKVYNNNNNNNNNMSLLVDIGTVITKLS